MKQECSVIVRWRDFIPRKFCQILRIAGLNIQSIHLN